MSEIYTKEEAAGHTFQFDIRGSELPIKKDMSIEVVITFPDKSTRSLPAHFARNRPDIIEVFIIKELIQIGEYSFNLSLTDYNDALNVSRAKATIHLPGYKTEVTRE